MYDRLNCPSELTMSVSRACSLARTAVRRAPTRGGGGGGVGMVEVSLAFYFLVRGGTVVVAVFLCWLEVRGERVAAQRWQAVAIHASVQLSW